MRQVPLYKIHVQYVKPYNDYMKTRYDEIRYHLRFLSVDISNSPTFQDPTMQGVKQNLLDYVEELRTHLHKFITMNPSDMNAVVNKTVGHKIKKKINVGKIYLTSEELSSEFDRNVYDFRTKCPKKNRYRRDIVWKKKFYEHIVDILEYERCKKEIIPRYREMGIKTCVYCNAQYAIGFSEKNGNHATYEFDHFHDKSNWPCFASSFYNLQPSCGSCNRTKSNNKYHFSLYSCAKDDFDVVKFRLPLALFTEFWLKPQKDLLKIEIEKCEVNQKNISKVRKKKIEKEKECILGELKTELRLENLYQEHRDEIEKILLRVKSNPLSYQKQLRTAYNNRNLQMFMSFHEFLYNFSKEPDDVHKQPLTKVKQDIFKQLSDIASFGKRIK